MNSYYCRGHRHQQSVRTGTQVLSTFQHAFVLLLSMASLFPQLLALSTNSDPRPTTRYLTGPTEALELSASKLPQTDPLGSLRKWLGASGFSELLGDSSPDHPIPLSGFASPAPCPVVKDLIPIISPSSCNTHSHSVPRTEHCYWHCRLWSQRRRDSEKG